MEVVIRRARIEDKARVLQVEATATPNLRYLEVMFDNWVHDEVGELIVAEAADELVGVAKYTVLADGSVWLEALRVASAAQGRGIGKLLYQRFFELSQGQGIPAMRMYTGVRNAASKGLAERFDFNLAATCRGSSYDLPLQPTTKPITGFKRVTDGQQARQLLLALTENWPGFVVMNRTFYAFSAPLCDKWTHEGKVYHDPASNSTIILGARFQAEKGLHLAYMNGDLAKCLAFAEQKARQLAVSKLICLYPQQAGAVEKALVEFGFQLDATEYIVMECIKP